MSRAFLRNASQAPTIPLTLPPRCYGFTNALSQLTYTSRLLAGSMILSFCITKLGSVLPPLTPERFHGKPWTGSGSEAKLIEVTTMRYS
jgi:hypothetical protein